MTVIASADDALDVAAKLSAEFDAEASARDAERQLPHEQVKALKESGLLAISVPAEHGGIDAPATVLAEVFRLIAHADPSLSQIPHSHFVFLEALRLQGTADQQAYFYRQVLDGALLANAQSERGPHPIDVDTTTLTRRSSGDHVLTGRKFYSTGALFADWLVVRASLDDGSVPTASTPKAVAFVPRDADGVDVVDDWEGMGQRTTASGTVTLADVAVPAEHVVPFSPIFAEPTTYGARAQLLHSAIDVGIATGALAAGVRQAERARPHFEANVATAVDDPTLIQAAAELTVTVRGAQALLVEAARAVDAANEHLTEESAAAASVAVAVAKVAAVRASLEAATGLFELGGTRSASVSGNLSRFWRDARTHTLHDPVRWKLQHIGRYTLSGTRPPRHGQI
ncbi:SfnB family sulfur acquisition oxidoreductase [Mycolicibacterium monacense]|uniref:Dibenzothiophene monooxygenase n=1 Tax=Mycolicibacterium monacense TaxID=85693 RepID=A0AAD1MYD2_MYCMB|nr:SfnB family sulfur acquisition oxidoreductase [Mycolicibacterium monacense]MDA4100453.1 acyl-CoA dehydrogenase [Mycolicibacterium monacense DSM 44395]ORB21395.1 SfnB family sulfur acquisition oxidoreductase [Mycolicibacterium monacense DSM 44395]QHP84715.1 SfnB family sulfur acquisition oxidoreductase [Mycolicibacterium monacense DSM 44395]BBZ62483.1 SfnB family sulfur acquisition oxidoreductase [Mycolicibacterium monacense]